MHPNTERVVAALRAAGCGSDVVELTEPARTAVDAADLLGVTVAQIANSLVFTADGEPVLVLTSGAHRVDTAYLGERLGARIERAGADTVRTATGFPIGGVAPVGFPAPLRVYVDEDLLAHDEVWAAGGTPHTLFPIAPGELVRVSGGSTVRVTP